MFMHFNKQWIRNKKKNLVLINLCRIGLSEAYFVREWFGVLFIRLYIALEIAIDLVWFID